MAVNVVRVESAAVIPRVLSVGLSEHTHRQRWYALVAMDMKCTRFRERERERERETERERERAKKIHQ